MTRGGVWSHFSYFPFAKRGKKRQRVSKRMRKRGRGSELLLFWQPGVCWFVSTVEPECNTGFVNLFTPLPSTL